MTTHELAGLLEHLRDGLGAALQKRTGDEFAEAAGALRSLPEKSLKELAKDLQKDSAGAGPERLLAQIHAYQAGNGETLDQLTKEVNKLKQPELQALIRALGQEPGKNKVTENKALVRRLLESPAVRGGQTPPAATSAGQTDQQIEEGLRQIRQLRDAPALSIEDLRARFAPIRHYPKAVLDGVAHNLGYDFPGGKDEVAEQLLQTLERMRISQLRGDVIKGSV